MFLVSASITACSAAAAFLPTTQLKSTTIKNRAVSNDKLFLQHCAQKIVVPSSKAYRQHRTNIVFSSTTKLHAAEDDLNTVGNNNNIDPSSRVIENDLGLDIIRGTGLDNADEIPDQTWEEIEQGAPSKLMVVKNVSLHTLFAIIIWGDFIR